MNARSMWAIMPVKPFAAAKRRLSAVLSRDERAELARLMLEDVLEVLAACQALSGIVVVTCDDTAGHIARSHGAVVLGDPAGDINSAVKLGVKFLLQRSDAGMIVVPADIPLLPASVIEELAACISRPHAVAPNTLAPGAVALVPAIRDGGTNLLACSPADAISPGFGPGSFERHCQAARNAGIMPTVLASERAGLDIDRPQDLADFISVRSATRSRAFLVGLDLAARLKCNAGSPDACRQIVKA